MWFHVLRCIDVGYTYGSCVLLIVLYSMFLSMQLSLQRLVLPFLRSHSQSYSHILINLFFMYCIVKTKFQFQVPTHPPTLTLNCSLSNKLGFFYRLHCERWRLRQALLLVYQFASASGTSRFYGAILLVYSRTLLVYVFTTDS